MRDLLYNARFHMDIFPKAGSSDASSDGAVPDGIGVRFNGYRFATVLGMVGAPGTSDGTVIVRLQYATAFDIASDNADSDYSNFSTDAATAALAHATSDQLNDGAEGFGIVHVDLVAHGLTHGCVRAQLEQNGTNTAMSAAVIVLSGFTGLGGLQGGAVAVTPVRFP